MDIFQEYCQYVFQGGIDMEKLDEYVNSVCKNLEGNNDEIIIMKQEMKNHLLQSVEELESQGKSQEESINIAIERFGEVTLIKDQLKGIYKTKKIISKKVCIIALTFMIVGIIALLSKEIFIYNSNKVCSQLLDDVQYFTLKDNGLSEKNLKILYNNNKAKYRFYNKDLKYIAVYKYPVNYDGKIDSGTYKNAECVYPSVDELNTILSKNGYIANASTSTGFLTDNNKWFISIHYLVPRMQWVDFVVYTLLHPLGIICIILSIAPFIISTLINIYHRKKINFHNRIQKDFSK